MGHAYHLHFVPIENRLLPLLETIWHPVRFDDQNHLLILRLLGRPGRRPSGTGRPGWLGCPGRLGRPRVLWCPSGLRRPGPGRLGRGGRRCCRHLVPDEVFSLATDVRNGKVGELHRVAALSRLINPARSFHVLPLSVHPEHVRRTPIADDRSHTVLKRCSELCHGTVNAPLVGAAGVVAKTQAEWAVPAVLREHHLHGLQHAVLIHRKRNCHLEGFLRVHAPAAGAVLDAGPIPGAVPA
mmetsp:Transcript_70603/g.151282  ORF Transcript_70603/g.151282 Transcript_70603/m.151282 type:complete len:240 (-) Transcript_70603:578-1297(-)